jgi:hypothetical protein
MPKDVFSELRDALKAKYPLTPVSVRRVKRVPGGLSALCERKDDHFLLRVGVDDPLQVQVDALCHEFAHALSFIEWENTGQHGPMFGCYYAECYNVYEKIVSAE